jgi:2-dehydropantoate 2-reductase
VNGIRHDFPLVSPDEDSTFDLIIIAVKSRHLETALDQIRGKVGPRTQILSLLNGITSEQTISAFYGDCPLAMILGIDAVRDGNETRFASCGKIFFGEPKNIPGKLSERVGAIARFFDSAGIVYEIPEDMRRTLWYKFMINVGVNQASAVLRAPYRVFQTVPEAWDAMESGMREVIALSQAVGVGLGQEDLSRWKTTLAGLHGEGMTSMLQDVLAKRKTEIEIFAGAVVELGRKYGIPTPANSLWFSLIRTIEETY